VGKITRRGATPSRLSSEELNHPFAMKTNLASLALFVAAFGCFITASPQAAPRRSHPTAYTVDHISRDGAIIIKIGTAESTVRRWLGTPRRKVGDDVWVYHHFRASLEEAQENDCRTLLLTIANGKVAQILLVNLPAAEEIAAMMKMEPDSSARILIAIQ
jgi:hypothetical protein